MNPSDGESSKRLTDALDQIFSGGGSGEAESESDDSSDSTDRPPQSNQSASDEPYELPKIIPATTDAPVEPDPSPTAPSLPTTQSTRPVVASSPAPSTTARAAQPATSQTGTASAASSSPSPASTGWTDHMTTVPVGAQSGQLRTPGRRPRVRRVTRVLRHIDPWSTFKVGLLFSLVTYLVVLTSGVLLWRVADSTGTLDNVERWFTQFGWETFELKGGEIFHNAWIIGLFGAIGMTGGLVLLATLFNLVSDIIGGIRVTVLEEEVVERTVTSTRRYVVRQGPSGAAAAPPQDWNIEDDAADEDEPAPAPSSPAASSSEPSAVPEPDWSIDD